MQWQIQEFPGGGGAGANMRFITFLQKTASNRENCGRWGRGGGLGAPPWIRHCDVLHGFYCNQGASLVRGERLLVDFNSSCILRVMDKSEKQTIQAKIEQPKFQCNCSPFEVLKLFFPL